MKLNHIRIFGQHVSGRINKSYSNSEIKSTRPRLPDSNDASKHKWPFFALPLWPAGRTTSRFKFPNPPSPSLSSLSV